MATFSTKKLRRRAIVYFFIFSVAGLYFWMTARRSHGVSRSDCLIIGMCADYRPFGFKNEWGGIKGFDVDLAQEVAKRLDKKVAIKDVGFDALLLSLQKGDIDLIISAMSITNDRLEKINMVPYYGKPLKKLALMFWGRIPKEIKTMADLATFKDKKGLYKQVAISVQAGTVQANFLEKQEGITARKLDMTSELVLDVQYRKSLAALVRHDVAYELQKKSKAIKILDIELPEEDWVRGDGVGVRKDKQELHTQVRGVIDQLRAEGFIDYLERKWFPKTQMIK